METIEMQKHIKEYFVKTKEDKFTKVKTIESKNKIEWKGKELENKFMLTKNSSSHNLSMGIEYRHVDNVDSVFFTFNYTNTDEGYPGLKNIKMYLILDDERTIELSDSSGFENLSNTIKTGDSLATIYLELAQLAVMMSDFIAIANAKKIEYSIRFGKGSLENAFDQNEIILFKGFYNAAFDEEFETLQIFNLIKNDIVKNEILGNFNKFNTLNGYECIKSDIEIEQFRFNKFSKPIKLEDNENVVIAVYSNSLFKSIAYFLITDKRLFWLAAGSNVKSIDLQGAINFEIKKNFFGIEKLVEKSSSFSETIAIDDLATEIAKLLNSIVKKNNGL